MIKRGSFSIALKLSKDNMINHVRNFIIFNIRIYLKVNFINRHCGLTGLTELVPLKNC